MNIAFMIPITVYLLITIIVRVIADSKFEKEGRKSKGRSDKREKLMMTVSVNIS